MRLLLLGLASVAVTAWGIRELRLLFEALDEAIRAGVPERKGWSE